MKLSQGDLAWPFRGVGGLPEEAKLSQELRDVLVFPLRVGVRGRYHVRVRVGPSGAGVHGWMPTWPYLYTDEAALSPKM